MMCRSSTGKKQIVVVVVLRQPSCLSFLDQLVSFRLKNLILKVKIQV